MRPHLQQLFWKQWIFPSLSVVAISRFRPSCWQSLHKQVWASLLGSCTSSIVWHCHLDFLRATCAPFISAYGSSQGSYFCHRLACLSGRRETSSGSHKLLMLEGLSWMGQKSLARLVASSSELSPGASTTSNSQSARNVRSSIPPRMTPLGPRFSTSAWLAFDDEWLKCGKW